MELPRLAHLATHDPGIFVEKRETEDRETGNKKQGIGSH
jgi:hypothetical protein